jgi:hypothetical protein
VLEREEAVEEKLGEVDFGVRGDAHDPAVVPEGIVGVFHRGMKHEREGSVNRGRAARGRAARMAPPPCSPHGDPAERARACVYSRR